MRTESLAIRYEKELRNQIGADNNENIREITDIEVAGFDSAAYYATEGSSGIIFENIIFRSDYVVITAFYYGSASLRDKIDQF